MKTARMPGGLAMLSVSLLITGCGLAMDDADRLDRAAESFAAGEYQAAVIDAKDVLRRSPDNLRGRILLGEASLAVGNMAGAEKELRRALDLGGDRALLTLPLARSLVAQGKYQAVIDEISPADLDPAAGAAVRRLRGDALHGLMRPAEARAEYQAALAHDPDDLLAQLGIAATYLTEGNPEQARNNLDLLLDRYAESTEVWLASGDLNRSAGLLENAKANYQVALDLAGEDVVATASALSGLVDIALVESDIEQAGELLGRLDGLAPASLNTQLMRARLAVLEEDWSDAQTRLQDILRRAPDFRPAQLLLGAVAYETGSYEQAEMYLSSVAAAMPDNVDARLLLSETRLAMGKPEEAAATLDAIGAAGAADPRVLSMSARISLSQGDADRAIADLERSLEADSANVGAHLQLALALIGTGRQAEVAGILDRIAVLDADNTGFQRGLIDVLVLLRDGQLDEALIDARQLAADWPDRAGGHNLLGAVELSSGRLDRARASFENALGADAANSIAERFLAQIDEREGELNAAAARYERIVAADPSASWAMFGRARVAATQQDFDAAAAWLERVLPVEPRSVSARETLVRVHAQNGDLDAARTVAEELVSLDSARVESQLLLGNVALQAADTRAAIRAFEEARRLEPGNQRARLRLAEAQRRAGDSAAALETLGGTGEIDYSDIASTVSIALLKADAGDFDEALGIAAQLQAEHTEAAAPHALEGEILIRREDWPKAADAYRRANEREMTRNYAVRHYQVLQQLDGVDPSGPLRAFLDANPGDPNVSLLLAQWFDQTDRTAESIRTYESLLEARPGNGVALNNLAWLYYTQGDPRAIDTARQARAALPTNGSVADTLGWLLVEDGQLAEGVELLEEAVDLSDGNAAVRYHLAVAYARQGETDSARSLLEGLLADVDEFDNRDDAERLLASL